MKAEREKWSGRVTAKALRFQTGQYELAEEEEICRIILVSGGSFTLVRGGESLLVNPGCVPVSYTHLTLPTIYSV